MMTGIIMMLMGHMISMTGQGVCNGNDIIVILMVVVMLATVIVWPWQRYRRDCSDVGEQGDGSYGVFDDGRWRVCR